MAETAKATLPMGTRSPRTVYLNGEFLPVDRAAISVDDRGFLFGDGVYEVMRSLRGRLFAADRHRRRLTRGLAALDLVVEQMELSALDEVGLRLIRDNGLQASDAMVYLQITRGAVSPRTHQYPPAGTPPTVFATVSPIPSRDSLRAGGASAITVPDVRWARCDLKTVNLLPNVMAKQRAAAAGAYEALFVRDGVLLEGAQTNCFAVIDGELRTAPETNYILPGVTRDVVLELARHLGIPVREFPILAHELSGATELMVTSTTSDVMPVVQLDGARVGSGEPGPVARALQQALDEQMQRGEHAVTIA